MKKYNPILKRVTVHKEILNKILYSYGKKQSQPFKLERTYLQQDYQSCQVSENGAYVFKEEMVPNDAVKEALNK